MLSNTIVKALSGTHIMNYRMKLCVAIFAHSVDLLSTYDIGYLRGMEHALYLLDQMCQEEFKKCLKEVKEMIYLKKIHRDKDDLYDLRFICEGKEIGVRRCIDFDSLEIEIKDFCRHIYNVSEIYQSVYYVSELVVKVEPIRVYRETEDIKISISNTNLAKYRKILLDAIDAHEAMTGKTEYDNAFHEGMQHALTILDNFCNDEFKAACVKALNKKFGGAKDDI